jgi:hypothetical protein
MFGFLPYYEHTGVVQSTNVCYFLHILSTAWIGLSETNAKNIYLNKNLYEK